MKRILKNGQMVLLSRIDAFAEGTGGAAGKKVSVKVTTPTWDAEAKQNKFEESWVAFWNSKDENGPKLKDRVQQLRKGDWIVILAKPPVTEGGDIVALQFLTREGGVITVDGGRFIVGAPYKVETKEINGKKMTSVIIPATENGNKIWNNISFWPTEKNKELPDNVAKVANGNDVLFVQAGEGTPYKETGMNSNGFRVEKVPANKADTAFTDKEPVADDQPEAKEPEVVMVNIGLYNKHPRALTDFVEAEDIAYLIYVTKHFEPATPEEIKQVEQIREYLSSKEK